MKKSWLPSKVAAAHRLRIRASWAKLGKMRMEISAPQPVSSLVIEKLARDALKRMRERKFISHILNRFNRWS